MTRNGNYRLVLRLPEALRQRIVDASKRYRRSMNAEIVARLEHSLNGLPGDASEAGVEPAFFPQLERTFRRGLSEDEDALIALFRRLSADQQAALLKLLGG